MKTIKLFTLMALATCLDAAYTPTEINNLKDTVKAAAREGNIALAVTMAAASGQTGNYLNATKKASPAFEKSLDEAVKFYADLQELQKGAKTAAAIHESLYTGEQPGAKVAGNKAGAIRKAITG